MNIMLLFVAFLIPSFHNQVSANKVVSYTQNQVGNQLYFPWKTGDGVKPINDNTNFEIKTSYGTYTVRCEVYEKRYPMMWLYTEDGILLDGGELFRTLDISSKTCDKSILELMIMPQKPQEGKTVVIYVLAHNLRLVCFERTYLVERNVAMAEVEVVGHKQVQCPPDTAQYIKDHIDFTKSGGIVHIMDEGQGRFEVSYKPQGQGIEILRKDFKGSTFKITCNEHKSYSGSTVMLGSVVHEVNFGVVLESFEMKSCSLDHINANRRIVNKENHFKTVFKMGDGTCEEREYKLGDERTSKNKYYNGLTIHRSSPKRVNCPSSFVGDTGENAFLPWLRIRFLRTIVLRWFKPEPYEVEV